MIRIRERASGGRGSSARDEPLDPSPGTACQLWVDTGDGDHRGAGHRPLVPPTAHGLAVVGTRAAITRARAADWDCHPTQSTTLPRWRRARGRGTSAHVILGTRTLRRSASEQRTAEPGRLTAPGAFDRPRRQWMVGGAPAVPVFGRRRCASVFSSAASSTWTGTTSPTTRCGPRRDRARPAEPPRVPVHAGRGRGRRRLRVAANKHRRRTVTAERRSTLGP